MFSEAIMKYRKENGLTRAEMAKFIFQDYKTYCRWEFGGGTPGVGVCNLVLFRIGVIK